MVQKMLTLKSPANHKPMSYKWPLDEHEAEEIVDTIVLVGKENPGVEEAMRGKMEKYDEKKYGDMWKIVETYNKAVTSLFSNSRRNKNTANQRLNQRPSKELLKHILIQVHNNAISDAKELNRYEAFSPETYGETSFEQVCQIIEELAPTEKDTFLDLGSGIGQVVLQVAALTDCKMCVGIEKALIPAKKAKSMDSLFRKWMDWYGKKFSEYKLYQGDFLDKKHSDDLQGSTVVFVNNFAFGPAIDHKLKMRFADLEEGTRIVSNKAFCPLDFRITDRNLTDIGTVLAVRKLDPIKESSVSWTDQPVSYYLHVKDSTMLERYFFNMTQKTKSSKSSRVSSPDHSVSDGVSEDPQFLGVFSGGFLEAVPEEAVKETKTARPHRSSSSRINSDSKRHKSCPSPLRECSNTHDLPSLDQEDEVPGAGQETLLHYSSNDSEYIRYGLRQLSKENKIVFHICTACDKKFRYEKGLWMHICRKGRKRIES